MKKNIKINYLKFYNGFNKHYSKVWMMTQKQDHMDF